MSEKAKKEYADGTSNIKPMPRKAVQCIETKEIFQSVTAAANNYKGSLSHLSAHLHGSKERPHFKGLHFKFVESNNEIK
jgi:hypothetical protein